MSLQLEINAQEAVEAARNHINRIDKKTASALRNAVNATTTVVKNAMIASAKERYTKTEKCVFSSKSVRVQKPKQGKFTSKIYTKGPRRALLKHDVTPNRQKKNATYSARVLATSSRTALYGNREESKPFIVKFQSGHRALVRRMHNEIYAGNGLRERIRKGWDTMAIREFYTVSVAQMAEQVMSEESAQQLFNRTINEKFKEQVQKMIEGKAKK